MPRERLYNELAALVSVGEETYNQKVLSRLQNELEHGKTPRVELEAVITDITRSRVLLSTNGPGDPTLPRFKIVPDQDTTLSQHLATALSELGIEMATDHSTNPVQIAKDRDTIRLTYEVEVSEDVDIRADYDWFELAKA